MSNKIKILYILGSSRSGSTLLDRLLGQFPGVVSVGELLQIWEKGYEENQPCACGTVFHECSFWLSVIKKLKDDLAPTDVSKMAEFGRRTLSYRRIPDLNIPEYYLKKSLLLYQSIHEVSGTSLIIDSSKSPLYAYYLSLMPDIDLSIIQLVRDSRAVTFSLQRKKLAYTYNGQEFYMGTSRPLKSALRWDLDNGSADILRVIRGVRFYPVLRYEDLVREPARILHQIMSYVGMDNQETFLDDHVAFLKQGHNINGNPMKFNKGKLNIAFDQEWITEMSPDDKRLVTILTYPFLLKYGYA